MKNRPAPKPQKSPTLPPLGVVLADDDGSRIQCHICGRWYARLAGLHIKSHGLTADAYREQYGLARNEPLSSPAWSAKHRDLAIAKREAGLLEHGQSLRIGGDPMHPTLSLQSRLRISAAERGRTKSAEHRAAIGAALAALRKPYLFTCPDCGVQVEAVGPRKRCVRCRGKAASSAYRARKRATGT